MADGTATLSGRPLDRLVADGLAEPWRPWVGAGKVTRRLDGTATVPGPTAPVAPSGTPASGPGGSLGRLPASKRPARTRSNGVRRITPSGRTGYTVPVASVADDLRARTTARVLAMTVPARIALALALGDDDLDLFMRSSGLGRSGALRRLRARRQEGRTPSACTGDRLP